jgi:hypothetical protein
MKEDIVRVKVRNEDKKNYNKEEDGMEKVKVMNEERKE